MPVRLIRDGILSSEPVCSLGWAQEVFYRRLMSVVDDYGRYHANSKLLRAACYPLQIDKVTDADIGKWLTECVTAGLVSVYRASDRKSYLQIEKFGQQVRSKSKYPEPDDCIQQEPDNSCYQSLSDDSSTTENQAVSICKQMLSDAHLDEGVGGVEDVILPTYLPTSRARTREGAFPISVAWEPGSDFWTLAKRTGQTPDSPDYSDAINEFVSYWLTNLGESRTQSQWEKAFLESWKRYRAHSVPADKTGRKRTTALSPHNDFEKRDYSAGINADGSF